MKLFLLSSLALMMVAILVSIIGAHPIHRQESEDHALPNENPPIEPSEHTESQLRADSVSPEHSL